MAIFINTDDDSFVFLFQICGRAAEQPVGDDELDRGSLPSLSHWSIAHCLSGENYDKVDFPAFVMVMRTCPGLW